MRRLVLALNISRDSGNDNGRTVIIPDIVLDYQYRPVYRLALSR